MTCPHFSIKAASILAEIKQLLSAGALPTSDISPSKTLLFFG
jgi:hypothetical protein